MVSFNPGDIDPARLKEIIAEVKKMDAQDGKEDGVISASIWNKYAETKGGNKVKNNITLKNAIKSMVHYEKFLNEIKSTMSFKAPSDANSENENMGMFNNTEEAIASPEFTSVKDAKEFINKNHL